MKILQVNCVYNNGSTGKLVYDIHTGLVKLGWDSIVCYGRGECTHETGVYKTCGEMYAKFNNLLSRLTGIMYGGCWISTSRLISVIKREKPDIVHLHCINGYFVNISRLIIYLKKHSIKTVLTLHSEFMYTGGCGYALDCKKWLTGCGKCPRLIKEIKSILFDRTHAMWKRMKKAFNGFENYLTVVSVSPWLKKRAEISPILCNFKHTVVLNGLNTDVFHPYNTEELRRSHHLTDEKIVFFVTPKFDDDIQNIKGGYYVLKLAEMMTGENIKFIIAGNHNINMSVPQNVILLGRISDQKKLAMYYSMADVTLLTSKKETFSMVVAESLCCGTPVVGFLAGAPEQIALPRYAQFSNHGDIEQLKGNLQKCIETPVDPEKLWKAAYRKYDKQAMINQYLDIYVQRKTSTYEQGPEKFSNSTKQ